MCNRYVSPAASDIERLWSVGGRNAPGLASSGNSGNAGSAAPDWRKTEVFPRAQGAFIRPHSEEVTPAGGRELIVGQWGLIPWFAKTPKLTYSTNNARSEELAAKATFKHPWARGQRCIIPAQTFDEPNWESGKNVWWRFRRADGDPWGLAGLWNRWVDKETGEVVESYTMLTINADAHPLMSRMHKPDPKLGPDAQDKRSVIPVELEDVDLWLTGTVEQAQALLQVAPVEMFDAGPMTTERR
jgi:putative SOS response-associated peptidase YedK